MLINLQGFVSDAGLAVLPINRFRGLNRVDEGDYRKLDDMENEVPNLPEISFQMRKIISLLLIFLSLGIAQGPAEEVIQLGIGTQDTTINCAAGGPVVRELLDKYLPHEVSTDFQRIKRECLAYVRPESSRSAVAQNAERASAVV